jgi:hypothetical protein
VFLHCSRDLLIGEQHRPDERLSREFEAFYADAGLMHGAERDPTCSPPDHERDANAGESESEEDPTGVIHSEKEKRITETLGDALLKARHCALFFPINVPIVLTRQSLP